VNSTYIKMHGATTQKCTYSIYSLDSPTGDELMRQYIVLTSNERKAFHR